MYIKNTRTMSMTTFWCFNISFQHILHLTLVFLMFLNKASTPNWKLLISRTFFCFIFWKDLSPASFWQSNHQCNKSIGNFLFTKILMLSRYYLFRQLKLTFNIYWVNNIHKVSGNFLRSHYLYTFRRSVLVTLPHI